MQNHGSKRGAAHARIGNPHHVLHARAGKLGRDGQVSGLRPICAIGALNPLILILNPPCRAIARLDSVLGGSRRLGKLT